MLLFAQVIILTGVKWHVSDPRNQYILPILSDIKDGLKRPDPTRMSVGICRVISLDGTFTSQVTSVDRDPKPQYSDRRRQFARDRVTRRVVNCRPATRSCPTLAGSGRVVEYRPACRLLAPLRSTCLIYLATRSNRATTRYRFKVCCLHTDCRTRSFFFGYRMSAFCACFAQINFWKNMSVTCNIHAVSCYNRPLRSSLVYTVVVQRTFGTLDSLQLANRRFAESPRDATFPQSCLQ